jgi:Tfp pilus assembly protein PilE
MNSIHLLKTMKKRTKYYFIEFLIVLIVLGILLLVTFPRFYDMQYRVKVAKAKKDLMTIMKAMQAYNLDASGYGWQSTYICSNQNDEDLKLLKTYTLTNVMNARDFESSVKDVEINQRNVRPFIHDFPLPILPLETMGDTVNWLPYYAVEKKERRWNFDRWYNTKLDVVQEAKFSIYWYSFYNGYAKPDYLGVTHGPRIDRSLRKSVEYHMVDGRTYYVDYNPTNGIMSHGFVVSSLHKKNKSTPTPAKARPTPWQPDNRLLTANVTEHATPVSIEDIPSLLNHQKTLFQSLDVTLQGTYHDNHVYVDPFLRLESSRSYIAQAIKDELPDGITQDEVKQYYETLKKPRIIPFEGRFVFDGDLKSYSLNRNPRLTRSVYPNFSETIQNDKARFHVVPMYKQVLIFDYKPESIKFETIRDFIIPFSKMDDQNYVTMIPIENGLVLYRWDDPNPQESRCFRIEAILDPSVGYSPRKCLFYTQRPSNHIMGELGFPQVATKATDGMYVELDEYKIIDGIYFPTRLRQSHWVHYPIPYYDKITKTKNGFYRGMNLFNVHKASQLNSFVFEYNLRVVDVKINQPVDQSLFWTDVPEGFEFDDMRKFVTDLNNQNKSQQSNGKPIPAKRGFGPYKIIKESELQQQDE